MNEQALTGVRAILLTVRISTVAGKWHLDERALPAFTGHTTNPRLRRAAEQAAKAGELLGAARAALVEASTLVEQIVPWPASESSGEPPARAG